MAASSCVRSSVPRNRRRRGIASADRIFPTVRIASSRIFLSESSSAKSRSSSAISPSRTRYRNEAWWSAGSFSSRNILEMTARGFPLRIFPSASIARSFTSERLFSSARTKISSEEIPSVSRYRLARPRILSDPVDSKRRPAARIPPHVFNPANPSRDFSWTSGWRLPSPATKCGSASFPHSFRNRNAPPTTERSTSTTKSFPTRFTTAGSIAVRLTLRNPAIAPSRTVESRESSSLRRWGCAAFPMFFRQTKAAAFTSRISSRS